MINIEVADAWHRGAIGELHGPLAAPGVLENRLAKLPRPSQLPDKRSTRGPVAKQKSQETSRRFRYGPGPTLCSMSACLRRFEGVGSSDWIGGVAFGAAGSMRWSLSLMS
jgi:hypothetical protein